MIRTVIFDLDGTLLNTLDDLAAAVNFALRTSGAPHRRISAPTIGKNALTLFVPITLPT